MTGMHLEVLSTPLPSQSDLRVSYIVMALWDTI